MYNRYGFNSKYKAKKCEIDGIKFDSMKEGNRYQVLKLMVKTGKIRDLQLQVPFELIPKQDVNGHKERACNYYADFTYYDEAGNFIVEDVKGVQTEVYKLKKKLMLYRYGISIKEV